MISAWKKPETIIINEWCWNTTAKFADIILPCPAYTEQDGFYTNLEGKLQKAFKASYPPGNAKEEWTIINELSKSLDTIPVNDPSTG